MHIEKMFHFVCNNNVTPTPFSDDDLGKKFQLTSGLVQWSVCVCVCGCVCVRMDIYIYIYIYMTTATYLHSQQTALCIWHNVQPTVLLKVLQLTLLLTSDYLTQEK